VSHSWMSSFVTCTSYAALLGFSTVSGAIAQSSETRPTQKFDSTIIVTGTKTDKKQIRSAARAFVNKAIVPEFDQYARRNDPICPKVVGVAESYADIVIAKFTKSAELSGVRVADKNCTPNIFVLFVNNGNKLMATLSRARPGLFAQVLPSDRKALFNNPVAIRWWYGTSLEGADGRKSSVGGSLSGPQFPVINSYYASLIDSKIAVNLTGTIIVIDIEKANGYPLDSVAAYAAMVSMAQIKPATYIKQQDSILSLFESGKSINEVPRDLTKWDQAFISALYETPPNRPGYIQKTLIAGKMAAKLSE
jgi:hypothetical protein